MSPPPLDSRQGNLEFLTGSPFVFEGTFKMQRELGENKTPITWSKAIEIFPAYSFLH